MYKSTTCTAVGRTCPWAEYALQEGSICCRNTDKLVRAQFVLAKIITSFSFSGMVPIVLGFYWKLIGNRCKNFKPSRSIPIKTSISLKHLNSQVNSVYRKSTRSASSSSQWLTLADHTAHIASMIDCWSQMAWFLPGNSLKFSVLAVSDRLLALIEAFSLENDASASALEPSINLHFAIDVYTESFFFPKIHLHLKWIVVLQSTKNWK